MIRDPVTKAVLSLLLILSAAGLACQGQGGMGGASGGASEPPALSGMVIDGRRVVEVKASRWHFQPNEIVALQGEDVRLMITSMDVEHGFALPDLGIDHHLPPGQTQTIAFTADQPGRHEFHCSIFCGMGHAQMKGVLIILPAAMK